MNCRPQFQAYWQMHDLQRPYSTVSRLLPPLIAFLLLSSMLVLFRKPATTFTNLCEIAIHASELSTTDSAWPGSWWMYDRIDSPLPSCVAFGTHDLYPFQLITARDVQTGDVLVRIVSPLSISIPPGAGRVSPQNYHFTSYVHDSEALVLIHSHNSESWPVNLFSIFTMERH